jgi:putative nucleotide binding protein
MEQEMQHKLREEKAIVLDFLPNGYPFDSRPGYMKTAIVQVLGKEHFVLLELVPKREITLQPNDEVYIGEGKRDKVHHINGRLPATKLTETAKAELKYIISKIVKGDEKKFVNFFNNARPLSTRMHSLELLPGMGKKRMWELIEARDQSQFESFADMKKRLKLMPDPEKAIEKRIMEEITVQQKHYLFADR